MLRVLTVMRTPIILAAMLATAALAAPAGAAITGPTPVHDGGVALDPSAATALTSDGHRYVIHRGRGAVERVWDERTGRTASVTTACHQRAATGRRGQFLLACGGGRYEVLDAPALRVHRLPLIRGDVEQIRVGRYWVEVMLYVEPPTDDSSASAEVTRLVDWRRSRIQAAGSGDDCHDVDAPSPLLDDSLFCWPLSDQRIEDGWLLERNYGSIMEDYDHLTLTSPQRRRSVLDRACVWRSCRPQLGAGWASWQSPRSGGGATIHAVTLSPRHRFTWAVRGHRAVDVGQVHTAHHLLVALRTGDGDRFRIEIARLPHKG
jgi:hypothetical protein